MIGKRLLELRKDADLTQDDLAEILKINKHSISAYERGKSEPPDDIKISIASFFDVSVDYLLGITDYPLSLRSQAKILRLPSQFPDEAYSELSDYIDFLIYKYKSIHKKV